MAAAQFWLVFTPQGIEEVKMITGDATLSKAVEELEKQKYPQTFPDPGPAKIIRRGVLSCSQFNSPCQLVLLQPQWSQLYGHSRRLDVLLRDVSALAIDPQHP